MNFAPATLGKSFMTFLDRVQLDVGATATARVSLGHRPDVVLDVKNHGGNMYSVKPTARSRCSRLLGEVRPVFVLLDVEKGKFHIVPEEIGSKLVSQ